MKTVAAFDFDGTLSTRDNLIPFLRRVAGTAKVNRALAAAVPALLAGRRNRAKAIVIRHALAGRSAAEVERIGEEFAARVVVRHLRPDVVARAGWHRRQGHALVIVSASLVPYVAPIGRELGFDAVLATEIEVHERICTGRFDGWNVRGREKVRRLDAWLGDEPAFVWAYGNSRGDRALLARADRPVRVTRKRIEAEPNPPIP